ncbi:LysM peptidoglycan-binding domain-containing protein [Nocardioides sp. Arc9.136]|uniref:LysM peptidoglycan-binding domain-containing protein n=1 Tax=Nocardioides sp. Arc9.136 TaxID=2996826 RepID=UPI00266600E2|nr:LysM domain-containing protein [Nocardioides sp. Arc9.136]WKN47549.1 LysM domain-containing protein [Nocardioides sp. Arc9.136]
MDHTPRGSVPRCLLVEVAATAALAGLAALAVPAAGSVARSSGSAFDDLLVGACAVVALVAASWLWLVTTAVVVEALRGGGPGSGGRGVPRVVRAAVLGACGVALVVPCAPALASADQPHPLHGLPMPDRATSTAAWISGALAHPQPAARTHVVRPGDTLWAIAAADVSPTAAPAAVTRRWHHVHDLNRAVIGDDPDLIRPGQRLLLPPAADRGDRS